MYDRETVEKIRKRLEAATPGKWSYNGYSGIVVETEEGSEYWADTPDNEDGAHQEQMASVYPPDHLGGHGDIARCEEQVANAELIAHAPADIRFLLAALAPEQATEDLADNSVICPHCDEKFVVITPRGPGVAVDEDGCCLMCGADAPGQEPVEPGAETKGRVPRELFAKRCGWCGMYETGDREWDEAACDHAIDPASGNILGPHQFDYFVTQPQPSEPVGEKLRVGSDMLAFLRSTQNRTSDSDPVVLVLAPIPQENDS